METNEKDVQELTQEQMDKVSGGAVLVPLENPWEDPPAISVINPDSDPADNTGKPQNSVTSIRLPR